MADNEHPPQGACDALRDMGHAIAAYDVAVADTLSSACHPVVLHGSPGLGVSTTSSICATTVKDGIDSLSVNSGAISSCNINNDRFNPDEGTAKLKGNVVIEGNVTISGRMTFTESIIKDIETMVDKRVSTSHNEMERAELYQRASVIKAVLQSLGDTNPLALYLALQRVMNEPCQGSSDLAREEKEANLT